jgi:HK97 family phage major capsid protein
MEWVSGVINGARHSPFSRIKSMAADITADDARAKGYVTAAQKKDEVITLLKRTTSPTTIYKKQKLDRDDIVDITDLDVVSFLKGEMRIMLDEEIARAVLVGDGRDPEDADKINESCIRPIYTDDAMYAHKIQLAEDNDIEDIVESIIRSREFYEGKGTPSLYTTTTMMMNMLLMKDNMGRRLYPTMTDLAAMLMVDKIVDVPVMAGLTRETGSPAVTLSLVGIIANINDYVMGADKGGSISMFDDFDIDYNQFKYLMETRMSGALIYPKSAIVIEQVVAG